MNASSRSPGRPRSAQTHHAILEATVELLAERGLGRLTMSGIAERAGAGKSTIYRWWDSKEDVVLAAVEAFIQSISAPDTGTLRSDLVALLKTTAQRYQTSTGQAILSLTTELVHNAPFADAFRTEVLRPRRDVVREVLDRGARRGELRSDIDRELVIDLLYGPLIYRLLVTGSDVDDAFATRLVDLALRGCAPPESPSVG